MSLPTKEELLKGMDQKSCLGGWHVLVSYALKDLAATVSDKIWEKGTMWNSVKFQADNGKVSFDMKIDRPTIQFVVNTQTPSAKLTMAVSGKATTTATNKVVDIPAGVWELSTTVPIVAISSKDHPQTVAAVQNVTTQPAHQTITIPQRADQLYYSLVFHFSTSQWTLANAPTRTGPTPDASIAIAQAGLASWIKTNVNSLDYTLARVEPVPGADTSEVLLVKEFLFTTYGSADAPVLSIWMMVSGVPAPTQRLVPQSFSLIPIPAGQQASIIISHEIIDSLFIQPAFKDKMPIADVSLGYSPPNSFVTVRLNVSGFFYAVTLNESFVHQYTLNTISPWTLESRQTMSSEVNFEQHPLRLLIANGEAKWSLDYDTYIGWQINQPLAEHYVFGKTKVNFHVDKTSKITPSQQDLSGSDFTFKASDVKITATGEPDRTEKDFLYYLGLSQSSSQSWSEEVPDELENLQMNFQDIEIHFKKLNFLLTKAIFAGKGDLIELDLSQGLMTPFDALMVGKINWTA